jgi:hypothetical protein
MNGNLDWKDADPGDDDDRELPAKIIARIGKSIDDGVFLRPRQPPADRHVIERIIWRPGNPNELARTIIRYCDRPMGLELDGRQFRVEPDE